jgi:hypothetical protein
MSRSTETLLGVRRSGQPGRWDIDVLQPSSATALWSVSHRFVDDLAGHGSVWLDIPGTALAAST